MLYLIFGALGIMAGTLAGAIIAVSGFLMLGFWMDVSSNIGVGVAASVVALAAFAGLIFGLSFTFKLSR